MGSVHSFEAEAETDASLDGGVVAVVIWYGGAHLANSCCDADDFERATTGLLGYALLVPPCQNYVNVANNRASRGAAEAKVARAKATALLEAQGNERNTTVDVVGTALAAAAGGLFGFLSHTQRDADAKLMASELYAEFRDKGKRCWCGAGGRTR
eukprot:5231402-Pleurochrysis_carterae.AAC.2